MKEKNSSSLNPVVAGSNNSQHYPATIDLNIKYLPFLLENILEIHEGQFLSTLLIPLMLPARKSNAICESIFRSH